MIKNENRNIGVTETIYMKVYEAPYAQGLVSVTKHRGGVCCEVVSSVVPNGLAKL